MATIKWRNILAASLAALLCAAMVTAEVAEFTSCNDNLDENMEPIQRNCTIHQLRVTPCPEAAEQKACKIKRGKSVTLSVDYTTLYPGTELSGRAYWSNQVVDLPLLGMDTNACNYTTCPIPANTKQTYTYDLEISNFFPVRSYDVKWKLWNDNTECCFITPIKLVR